jgi:hypothetical protein
MSAQPAARQTASPTAATSTQLAERKSDKSGFLPKLPSGEGDTKKPKASGTPGVVPKLPSEKRKKAESPRAAGKPPPKKARNTAARTCKDFGRSDDEGGFEAYTTIMRSKDRYHFSVLMHCIGVGEIAMVPDDLMTRAVILSMWGVFNKACGEGNPFLALRAMSYGAFVVGANSLARMAGRPSENELPSVREGLKTGKPMLFSEPSGDAVRLARQHGCTGPDFNRFMRNFGRIIASRSGKKPDKFDRLLFSEMMSASLRTKLGLPDPRKVRRQRELLRLSKAAVARCVREYSFAPFCRCVVGGLKKEKFADDDWRRVSTRFSSLAGMGKKYRYLRTVLHSCNK